MSTTAVTYEIIARDMASKAFLGVAASAKEQQVAVTKAFSEQAAVAKRANQQILSSLRAEEAAMARAAAASKKYGATTAYLTSHKESLDKIATGLAGVGVAAAVGFGAAVKQSMNFSDAMARVGAFSDDARAHLGELRKLAMTAGTSMGYSATQSANAMEELVKAGVSTKNMINGGLKGSLALAAAGQIDVSQATQIAAAAMTQFGLTGSKIPHVADLLAAGADKALGGVSDLGEALSYSGVQAHQYKVSIEGTIGTLAAFAQNGQLGSMAGTTFSQMLARLGAPTGKAAAEMKKLNLSAYDANGQFVTMPVLAGRLHKAFTDLSPAARNSAEQIIFGQRAIRGANVLIKEGSGGIQDWIKKVNDQGFAAQTAGRKLDSLKGDLTKLRAAFQTALIGAGTGSQGPLRQAVQQVTKYVNAWNGLSDTTKSAVAEIVGAVGALGLGGAVSIKVLGFLAAGKKALIDLGLSGRVAGEQIAAGATVGEAGLTRVQTAARATGAALKVVAAALIAVPTTNALFSGVTKQADASATQIQSDLLGLAKSSKDASKSLSDVFSVHGGTGDFGAGGGGNALTGYSKDIAGLSDAMNRLFNRDSTQKVNDWATSITSHLGSSFRGTYQILQDQAKQVDAALTQMEQSGQASQAQDAFNRIAATAAKSHVSLQQLMTLFPEYQKSLQQQANDLKVTNLSAKDYAAWMGGKIPKAIQAAIAARNSDTHGAKENASATLTAGQAAKQAADKIKEETAALVDNRKKYIADANAAISASNDTIAYKQSITDATQAIKQNGHTLDLNTQKGRDNRTALNNMASSSLNYIQDLIKQGKSQKDISSATEDARKKFINIARQMGLTRGEAKKLADQFGLNKKAMDAVPKKVVTKVTAPGTKQTIDGVNQLITTVRRINGKTVTIKYNVLAGGSAVKIQGHGGITATAMATGGPVRGIGTGTSDQVPIMGSNGEHMWTALEVARAGGHQAMMHMRRLAKAGMLPKFANGGPIDKNIRLNTLAPAGAAAFLRSGLAGTQSMINSSTTAALKKAMTDGSLLPSIAGLSGGTSSANQRIGLAMMLAHGWGMNQWPALKALWTGESGWSQNAYNNKSGATGIPQSLPASKMASAGPDWRTNPATQIRWGLGYIASAYGSPSNAYARWLSRDPHWYASGTNSALPGMAIVGERGPEAVMFRGGERVMPHQATASLFGTGRGFSVQAIVKLIQAISQPTKDLAKFTMAVRHATLANEQAQARVGKHSPLARAMDRAVGTYNRARTSQANLRLSNAHQTEHARTRVANASEAVKHAQLQIQRMEPANAKIRKAQSSLLSAETSLTAKRRAAAASIATIEDKIRATKRGTLRYQDLLISKQLKEKQNARDIAAAAAKVHTARKAADKAGVNTAKITRAQQDLARAERALTTARANQSKVSRENALQTAEASARVAAAERVKQAATAAYNKVSDTAKAKAEALKTAQQNLAQAQQAVADSAKQTSDAFTGMYSQAQTSSITDLLKSMRTGASDITGFTKLIDKLRGKHVKESVISQIMSYAQSNGLGAGSTLAQQALNGGSWLIKQLNGAAQSLQKAGDVLGYKTATAPGGTSGYASGTNWASAGIHSVGESGMEVIVGKQRRRFHGGEQVLNTKALNAPQVTELHVHFDGPIDSASAAREIEALLRDHGTSGRYAGGVHFGARTR